MGHEATPFFSWSWYITLAALLVVAGAGDGDGSDGERHTNASSAGYVSCVGMIYVATGVAAAVCKMCGQSSNSPSPLIDSLDNDAWCGMRPWLKKRPHPEMSGYCVAKGKICAICNTVFFASSLALEHGCIMKYWKWQKAALNRRVLVR